MRLFNLLISAGGYLSESSMKKFFTGEGYFSNDKPAEEIAEYEKKRDGLCLLHKMMIYAAESVGEKDIADWQGKYEKESGDMVVEFDEIRTQFGFLYSKEDFYKVAEDRMNFTRRKRMESRPEITKMLSVSVRMYISPRKDLRIYWAKEVIFDYATTKAVRVDYMKFKPVNNTVSGIE